MSDQGREQNTTMCAKDASMCAKGATICGKDATMCAKRTTGRDHERQGRNHDVTGRDDGTTTASTPARGASLRRSSRDFCTSTPSKSTRRTTLDPCYGSARHDANATASRRYGADAARVVPQEPSAFLGFR